MLYTDGVTELISAEEVEPVDLDPRERTRIRQSLAHGALSKARASVEDDHEFQSLMTNRKVDMNIWASMFRHRFLNMVADEGHKIKNTSSKFHRAAFTVFAPHNWISSATPANNTIIDSLGFLNIFWSTSFLPKKIDDGDITQ